VLIYAQGFHSEASVSFRAIFTIVMKVAVVSQYREDIVPVLEEYGIEISDKSPDAVVAYGGDGTFLRSEREFPGLPKFPLRENRTAPLCAAHNLRNLVECFASGKLEKSELIKIDGFYRNKKIAALNDIFIHNYNRNTAIRCSVWIDDELYLKESVNDAIGIATPHGSTAYFRSITNCIFRSGIGLAFSNSRDHTSHIVVPECSVIRIKVTRGPVLVVNDNSNEMDCLETGEEISVRKSEKSLMAYGLKDFMCPSCRAARRGRS
jgi:NAD+ kinase